MSRITNVVTTAGDPAVFPWVCVKKVGHCDFSIEITDRLREKQGITLNVSEMALMARAIVDALAYTATFAKED